MKRRSGYGSAKRRPGENAGRCDGCGAGITGAVAGDLNYCMDCVAKLLARIFGKSETYDNSE